MNIANWFWEYTSEIMIPLSLLVSLVTLYYYKKFTKTERVFIYYVWTSTIFEIIAYVTTKLNIENNLPGLHLYTLIEFILISCYFAYCFRLLKIFQPIKTIVIGGSILIITNSIFFQSIFVYNSYSKSAVESFIIMSSIFFYYSILQKRNYDITKIGPSVYFVTSLFLKASVSIIVYLYSNEILKLEQQQIIQLFSIKNLIQIIAMIIASAGFIFIISERHYETKIDN